MTMGYHGDMWPISQGPHDAPPSIGARSDELLREQIEAELANTDIDATGIEVTVSKGVAELGGVVADARAMVVAMEIAQGLLGVERAVNALHVEQKQ
jgi:osmotically-inducible protein OsmY